MRSSRSSPSQGCKLWDEKKRCFLKNSYNCLTLLFFFSLFVGFENQVRGFMLRDLSRFHNIKTCENSSGVFALQNYDGLVSVASPSVQEGSIHLAKFRHGKLADGFKPLAI